MKSKIFGVAEAFICLPINAFKSVERLVSFLMDMKQVGLYYLKRKPQDNSTRRHKGLIFQMYILMYSK